MSCLSRKKSVDGCLSHLALDRLLAEEKTGLDAANQHIAVCQNCWGRLETLRRQKQESLEELSVLKGVNQLLAATEKACPEKSGLREKLFRPLIWAPVAAVFVSALLVFLLLPKITSKQPIDTIRIKGTSSTFEVLTVIGNQARPIKSSEYFNAGDVVVFKASASSSCLVSILSVDTKNKATVLSYQGQTSWPIQPGPPVQLPISAELDQGNTNERLFAFFCPKPLQEDSFTSSVEKAYPKSKDGRRDLDVDLIKEASGCMVHSVLLKRAASKK